MPDNYTQRLREEFDKEKADKNLAEIKHERQYLNSDAINHVIKERLKKEWEELPLEDLRKNYPAVSTMIADWWLNHLPPALLSLAIDTLKGKKTSVQTCFSQGRNKGLNEAIEVLEALKEKGHE